MFHNIVRAATEEQQTNPLIPAIPDLLWSSVAFVILLVFFWKFVLPRVQVMLDARAEAIEGNIAKADEAQRQAESLLEQYTAQLADARAEAGQIRESARADSKQIVAEAKESAVLEAARITATAHAQIEAERQAALISLRGEVGGLALGLASNVIGESLNDDKKATAIVDRFLAELEAETAGK